MNKQELNQGIQACIENAGIEMYLGMKDGNVLKANIRNNEQGELAQMFINEIATRITQNNDVGLIDISAADDRNNVIYRYDLENLPEELSSLNYVIENEDIPIFSFQNNELSDINSFIFIIGNANHQLVIYKQNYPINLFRRHSTYAIKKGDNQFERMDDDFLKINSKFDFFKIENTLFILDLKTLERFFGFHDVIKTEAERGIQSIEEFDLLENPQELRDMLDDISFARKLTKISSISPVLGIIPNDRIIEFASNHPALRGKIRFNNDMTKISLHSKKAKQLFLKILNDDYLISELTTKYYDSLAKDIIEEG